MSRTLVRRVLVTTMTTALAGLPTLSYAQPLARPAHRPCSEAAAGQGTKGARAKGRPADVGPVALCGSDQSKDPLWVAVVQCKENHNRCLRYTSNYILKRGDPPATNNYLLIPTLRIKGIECPYLWSNANPPKDYWEEAWTEAHRSPAHVRTVVVNGRPLGVGLGVNAKTNGRVPTRRYDQLHIHMANIRAGVRGKLDSMDSLITDSPSKWATSLASVGVGNRQYRVLKLRHDSDLNHLNLFKLLHDYVVAPGKRDMARQMLVVTKRLKGGYYVLNSEGSLPEGRGTSTVEGLLAYY